MSLSIVLDNIIKIILVETKIEPILIDSFYSVYSIGSILLLII